MTFFAKTPGVLPIQNTSAALIATNPVLLYGQIALETDTNRTKSGDGVTAYTSLTYAEWAYEEVEAAGTDTYTGNFSKPFFLTYFKYMRIRVRFANANTGAATINLNSEGAIAIKKNVSDALVSGDIKAGGIYELVYDGTNFQMITSGGNSSGVVPAALTRVDDTNVTLTLGGTPATALLQDVSITVGWSGQLSLARGGTNANLTASNGGIFYSTGTAGAILSGTATAGQMLRSGASAAPTWSTNTWPNTTAINQILFATSANVIGGSTTLLTDGTYLILGGTALLGTEILSCQKNHNGKTAFTLSNTTSGTAAKSQIEVLDSTGLGVYFIVNSPLWTTSGMQVANSGALYTDKAAGLNVGAASNAPVAFWSNNTERARFLSTGEFLAGYTALGGSETFGFRKNQNGDTQLTLSNTTSGTSGTCSIRLSNSATFATQFNLFSHSAAFTTSGIDVADAAVMRTSKVAGLNIGTTSNTQMSFWTNALKRVAIPATGGVVIGTAALATNATDGFLYIPTCAGTPTGAPTAQTGTVAMVFDTTNNKLYIYDGSWLGGTTPGAFT